MTDQQLPPCTNCGKPTPHISGGAPVCIDCYAKAENARANSINAQLHMLRHAMAMQNQAAAEMDFITGLGQLSPRIKIPPMPTTGPVTFHNIKLDNSVVGVINTGTVSEIDVNLTEMRRTGQAEAVEALQKLTQLIASDQTLSRQQKNALLEQLAVLSSEATANPAERKPGVVAALFEAITKGTAAVSGLSAAWQALEPILKGIFGS